MRVGAVSEGETGVFGREGVAVLVVHDEGLGDGVDAGAASMGFGVAVMAGVDDEEDDDGEGDDESTESAS
jgi:hypothetical protein